MLALGAASGIVDPETSAEHLRVARELTRSCFEMYYRTATGIGPENASFEPRMASRDRAYHLRPSVPPPSLPNGFV